MLNGKFFTGLPPKMIDRNSAAPNRQQSNFFWPDDSRAETAVEMRLKRRNSMQTGSDHRPVYEKQISLAPNEVDTKERFSKEFSKSSIQFYDNLNESNPMSRRRTQLPSRAMKKLEIAEKPTATKLEMPESVVDEAYTTAKKKQAYTSKIEFYDYVNEEDANARRNNLRKPKMDMNDKREMELNSKNSPKLQIKRDVRSLSEEKEMPKLNNREVKTLERTKVIKEKNVDRSPKREEFSHRSNTSPTRSAINKNNNFVTHRERPTEREDEHRYSNVSPQRNRILNDARQFSERDLQYRKSNNSVLARNDYDNYRDPDVYERQQYSASIIGDIHPEEFREEYSYNRHMRNDARHLGSRSQLYDYPDSRRGRTDFDDEVGYRMKSLRIMQQSPPPRRQQYYRDVELYDDDLPKYSRQRSYVPDNLSKRGNFERQRSHHNDADSYEPDMTYIEDIKPAVNSSRSGYNRVTNKLNNETHQTDMEPTSKERTSKTTSRNATAGTSSSSAMNDNRNSNNKNNNNNNSSSNNDSKKHLRSSLCFHDGAIIAENDATQTAPTSTTTRRNARSSATKRVSVGLPD